MPDVPAIPRLPAPPSRDLDALATWAESLTSSLRQLWTPMVYTLNALCKVETLANRSSTPDLNEILFVASDTTQVFVAIDGAWVLVGGGAAHVNTTQVGTSAVVTAETLMSYALPANVLSTNGRIIMLEAWGTTAANANVKTMRLNVAATTIASLSGAYNGQDWRLHGRIIRTGVDAQDLHGWGLAEQTITWDALALQVAGGFTVTTAVEDDAAAITLAVTGQNGTAAANDIVCHGFVVRIVN